MSGLFLEELSLSHFRSHRKAKLRLNAGPVALFGPNGAGKTNILEAISMLSPGRGLRGAASDEMLRRPEGVGWKVSAVLHSGHQVHEIETWAEPERPRQVQIDGKAAPQIALGRVARMLWLVPAMDRLWIEGADGRRRFLDRATMSFEPGHAEAVLVYDKAMRERNRLLKDMVRDVHWYAALEAQLAEAGARITANRRLAVSELMAAQDASSRAFPSADLELIQSDGELPGDEAGLARALADGRARDMSAGRTLIGPHRSDLSAVMRGKGVAARDCSTGEQKALLISLILANARSIRDMHGAPPILLLDEVAAHLDAGRRTALYDEICALGAQAWMTGTGRELFAELGARAGYYSVCEEAGVSIIHEEGAQ